MRYLSLFSGIAGFEKGIEDAGLDWECIGYSEIDKYARAIYSYHYPNHKDYGDATEIDVSRLPDFDLLVGGFPCQAFSVAGKQRGFDDTRGTLFFEIARILRARKPRWFLLENVKNILSHNDHRTILTIHEVLTELGYTCGWQVVNSCKFGVPQNRERAFFVGHLGETAECIREILPVRTKNEEPDGRNSDKLNGIKPGTWRTHKDGRGFREVASGLAPTIPARAREDGSGQPVVKQLNPCRESGNKQPYQQNRVYDDSGLSPTIDSAAGRWKVRAVLTPDRLNKRQNGRRFKNNEEPSFTLTAQDKHGVQVGAEIRRLTPRECERLQGFPDEWTKYGLIANEKVEISDTQRYKSLGNAVTVSVIEAFASKINKQIQKCS